MVTGKLGNAARCHAVRSKIRHDVSVQPPGGFSDLPTETFAWLPDPQVEAKAAGIFYDDLPPLSVGRLSGWLAHRLELRAAEHSYDFDLYADALFDLSQLGEEFRFQAAAGALYSLGLQDQIAAAIPAEPMEGAGIGVPTVVRALLAAYMRPTPSPSALLHDPGQSIAGHRVLGGWWAAQLFDSALIRGMSALDRLAIL